MMRVWKIEIFAIVADASYSLHQLYQIDEFCLIFFILPLNSTIYGSINTENKKNIVHYYIAVPYTDEIGKVVVKSSMARSLPVENLLPQNVGSNINSTTCSNVLKHPIAYAATQGIISYQLM